MDVLLLTGYEFGVFFFLCDGITIFQHLEGGSGVVCAVLSAREVGLQGLQTGFGLVELFKYQGFEFLKVFIGIAHLWFFFVSVHDCV